MVKTSEEIERDFYTLIKASTLGSAIKGSVYRDEMRPSDAETEDIVIKFLSGLDEQVQTGIVILRIYVPDLPKGKNGKKVIDHTRIAELQSHYRTFIDENGDVEYDITSDQTPYTTYEEEIEQHFIYCRIHFNRITA